ncbi:hypothetical protein PSHT_02370 [Puccinia striiformis]|uniref:Aromatic amino acid beta-eliminating lyase/threonine aldolase domain-containing protein n=1 Tax=Puccinia striiformis TaxID=27350 RepID=A0A2S4WI80_9BASI|nr:hypothetical protein PSHT_02370 [Puccinia striiformis]
MTIDCEVGTQAVTEMSKDFSSRLNMNNTNGQTNGKKLPFKTTNSYVQLNLPKGGYREPESNEEKRILISRDFRSDTMTAPTEEMFEYMKSASIGDDVYGVEFLPSHHTTGYPGRFVHDCFRRKNRSNDWEGGRSVLCQWDDGKNLQDFFFSHNYKRKKNPRYRPRSDGAPSIRYLRADQPIGHPTWLTQPPHSVLCDSRAHIHNYEAGGIAFHSQATTIPVKPKNDHTLTLEDVQESIILSDDIHYAPTKLVCLENTIRGLVHPLEEMQKIRDFCHENDVITHCDGARIWEAAVKTGHSIAELCEPFDSVSLCLSKGLGAPIGSVLVGPRDFIKKVRWFRKMFGGGIRQCGSIVAAADYCVTYNFPRLAETHRLARHLADRLVALGVRIAFPVETNHVFIDPSPIGIDIDELCRRALEELKIRIGGARLIVHIQVSPNAVEELVGLVARMKDSSSSANGGCNGSHTSEEDEPGLSIAPRPAGKRT